MTDPIADMLTRLRNAVIAKHARVDVPASKLKVEIAKILEDEGYIQGFKMADEKSPEAAKASAPRQVIRIFLKYGPRGEKVTASPKFTIDAIDDQPPTVTFEKPKRDIKANPVEEVIITTAQETADAAGDVNVTLFDGPLVPAPFCARRDSV